MHTLLSQPANHNWIISGGIVVCSLAAKCILAGFGLLNMPKSFEVNVNSLSFHPIFALPCHLTLEEVAWVTFLGRFRAHFSTLEDAESRKVSNQVVQRLP